MTEPDISPIARLAEHARGRPDSVALVYEDRDIGFAELHDRVGELAGVLAERGVMAGDRVAYLGLNSATLVTAYLACAWIGAVFVPVSFRLSVTETVALLENCRPRVVLAEGAQAQRLGGLADYVPVVVDELANPLTGGVPSAPVMRTVDDLAALLYTSGTTGRPKGVMMSHGNILWNQRNVDAVVDTRPDDVYLVLGPMSHIGGLNSFLLGGLARGATSVIRRTVTPEQVLSDLVDRRVTGLFAVPAILASVARLDGFTEADLSALRCAVVGGAPVSPSLIEAFARKGVTLQQSWGMTETASFGTYLPPDQADRRLGSAGLPMPHTELRVVDLDTAEDAVPGEPGEIWVRGPNIVAGYWDDPVATAAAFTPDGWFRTGDIACRDAEGYITIVDRLKDMIITGGENVYPAEVERVLAAHPAVTDVGVVGAEDERWGETVVAVVSVMPGASLSLDAVRDFGAEQLARFKLPTRIVVTDVVPRNGSGKLDKKALRELVRRQ